MQTQTIKHSNSYKLQWFNKSSEMKFFKQASIWFSVSKYNEELIYDIMPMFACHVLSRRPWKFDRDIVNLRRSNKYTFLIERKKFVLAPLTPYLVSGDYKAMKELREMIRVEETKVEGTSSTIISTEGGKIR